ncbi:MAG: hypothetical protein J6N72_02405 [Psychrobacter sp.]|nr:hypothetical protein [Psychrobacter sp.]
MIEVYVCHKPHYDALLKDKLQQDAVIYPEIEVPYYDWFGYYNENKETMKEVVTQSSEFIKFLQENEIECKIMVLVADKPEDTASFVVRDFHQATNMLLGCYQNLMFIEALTND